MKKIIALLLALSMCAALTACNAQKEPAAESTTVATTTVQNITESDEVTLIPVKCQLIEDSRQYQGLNILTTNYFSISSNANSNISAALSRYSNTLKTDVEKMQKDAYDSAVEDYGGRPDMFTDYGMFYSIGQYANIKRADSRVVSFVQQEDTYMGGVHPNSLFYGVNYDTKTGQELALDDVVQDVDALPKLISDLIRKNYPDSTFSDDNTEYLQKCIHGETDEDGYVYKLEWVLSYRSLDIIFSPYEISSYAAGMLHVSLPFADYPELFNEYYTTVPESFVYADGAYYNTTDIDFDLDGQADDIYCEYNEDEAVSLEMNGSLTKDKMPEGPDDLFFVYCGGKHYIYAQAGNQLFVFGMKDGTLQMLTSIQATFTETMFTNPNALQLKTKDGIVNYRITDDGLPEVVA